MHIDSELVAEIEQTLKGIDGKGAGRDTALPRLASSQKRGYL